MPNGKPKQYTGNAPVWKKLALTTPPIANAYNAVALYFLYPTKDKENTARPNSKNKINATMGIFYHSFPKLSTPFCANFFSFDAY